MTDLTNPSLPEDQKFWLSLREPGCVPQRKGPWPITETVEILREFISARPTAYIDYITVDSSGCPEIEHGPEVLQMADGRSMSTGRKHNQRVREAEASLPEDDAGLVEYHYIDMFRVIRGAGKTDRNKAMAAARYLAEEIQSLSTALAEAREKAIEECAKIAEKIGDCSNATGRAMCCEMTGEDIADAIRSLTLPEGGE